VMVSAVYRQSHFAIDVVAGAAAAPLLYYVVTPVLGRALAPAATRLSSPGVMGASGAAGPAG
jgi:hypothetical protein